MESFRLDFVKLPYSLISLLNRKAKQYSFLFVQWQIVAIIYCTPTD